MFTVLSLSASLLQNLSESSQQVNAVNAQAHARNIEFVGLYDNLTMSPTAHLQHHFSLWDYDTSSEHLRAVMQRDVTSSSWRDLQAVDWPGAGRPLPDTCEFYQCNDDDNGG